MNIQEQLEYVNIQKGSLFDILVDYINQEQPQLAKDITFEEAMDFVDAWIEKRLRPF